MDALLNALLLALAFVRAVLAAAEAVVRVPGAVVAESNPLRWN